MYLGRARGLVAASSAGLLSGLAACTTYITPATCVGEAHQCEGETDVRFCEVAVLSSEGADCTDAGLVPGRRFCVATRSHCVSTHYSLSDGRCEVREYERVRDSLACSSGTPTFRIR
jgi:hypothetical protein